MKSFLEIQGIDYDMTHIPVSRMESLRKVLSTAMKQNMESQEVEVVTEVLNATLEDATFLGFFRLDLSIWLHCKVAPFAKILI